MKIVHNSGKMRNKIKPVEFERVIYLKMDA
jgi:hypothetical protein